MAEETWKGGKDKMVPTIYICRQKKWERIEEDNESLTNRTLHQHTLNISSESTEGKIVGTCREKERGKKTMERPRNDEIYVL